MSDIALDPLERFVDNVRAQVAGTTVVVGPVSVAGTEGSYLVEVVGAARQPIAERPCVSLNWHFELPKPGYRSRSAKIANPWETAFVLLAKLLRRDFETVEQCGNQLDFSRAVEKRWPCARAKAAREHFEAEVRRRAEWDERRNAYIAKRVREGVSYSDASIESLDLDLPNRGCWPCGSTVLISAGSQPSSSR